MKNTASDKFPHREWKVVKKIVNLYEIDGDVEGFIRKIKDLSKGMKDSTIHCEGSYDGYYELEIQGHVRKTPEEIAEFDRRALSEREKARILSEKKKKQEIGELKRLKSKYPEVA